MNIICYYQTRPSNQKGRWDVFIYLFQNILCYYQTFMFAVAVFLSISKHPMLLPNESNRKFQFFTKLYFKTSYVTTKPTVLSHFSAHQFTRNRSTAGFYLNFTNRRSIFIMIPENASFPCKIRLFSMFTKIPVGKPLL